MRSAKGRLPYKRLASAIGRLEAHHGSSAGDIAFMGKDGGGTAGAGFQRKSSTGSGKGYWKCFGCQYMVPCGEFFCNGCGHQPPLHVSCPGTATAGKGGGNNPGKPTAGKVGGKDSRQGETFAQHQLKAQLAASKAELAKTKKALAEAGKAAPSKVAAPNADMAVEDSGDGGSKAELKAMRSHLKSLQELPPALQAQPGIAREMADLDGKLQAAILAKREAKPLDVRLSSSEAHVAKMERLEAEACQKTAELQAQQAKLAKQLDEQRAAQAEAEAKTVAAKEGLAKIKAILALNLSAEAGAAHAADPAGIVVPPGCVSIQHAEAVLAEQLALRDAAMAQAIAVAEEAPDEADDDTGSVSGSAAAKEGSNKKKARKQRAIGAQATIAHVRGHNFAKPKWG